MPMLHLEPWSLSRLNGRDADRISRCGTGEVGDVTEADDISGGGLAWKS